MELWLELWWLRAGPRKSTGRARGRSAGRPPADAEQDVVASKEAGVEDDFVRTPARPGTMFKVDYRIVGTPVVGSPVSIDLEIDSTLGDEPVEIGYQIPDPSALAMDEAVVHGRGEATAVGVLVAARPAE